MTQPPTPDPAQAIPPMVRTVVYYVAGVAGVLGTAVIGMAAIVAPDAADSVAAFVGVVLGTVSSIAGWLGVAYRPTIGSKP